MRKILIVTVAMLALAGCKDRVLWNSNGAYDNAGNQEVWQTNGQVNNGDNRVIWRRTNGEDVIK
ncbi:membrane lipoprotein lipid attachment site-containing protein [Marinobacter zhejiangensis]|uniref:Type IV secretion system putative lipoprotein virB7 n=1 Tax=Marinobacter zhejiangensis TaxID=488535 RepID=A0A1I4R9A0_9GAMM|nr:membrane lipoprotein lipid attachment site-containing protein [Marinobacter zhejiangensis]SFM48841.1 hypothetical protein SAMN04487963_2628 [Marinobacter zhejiangensis]